MTQSFLKNKRHIVALYEAAKACGIDPSTLSATSPFGHSGKTAVMIQSMLQEQDPVIAAEMARDSGLTPNLAAVAELLGGGELSEASRQELIKTDPQFAAAELAKAQAADAARFAQMEQASENMRLQRFMQQAGGNEQRARHLMQVEDAAHQAQSELEQSFKIKFAGN